jgi:hypothetical protein
MLLVVTAVANHGSLVACQVIVQLPNEAFDAVQAENTALVIVKAAALETSAVNRELRHDATTLPKPGCVLEKPKLGESSVCSEPIGPQLAAEAVDGITNAHTANTAVKSRTLAFENFMAQVV